MWTADLADQARNALRTQLEREAEGVWFAPGRVNLIGEHTDYNDGFVLPLALPQGTAVAVAARDDERLRMTSTSETGVTEVSVPDLAPGQPGGWATYAAATVWAMREVGHAVPGLDLAVAGDVPLGAGLSSSASLECAVASALDGLVGAGLGRTALSRLARHAENDYVGMPCGVMDQMASMHGQTDHLVFLDTRSLQVDHVPFELAAAGLTLLVVDTRAPHRLVDGAYADRRATCEHAAALLGLPALRDVEDLDAALSLLPSERLVRRVRHVVTENRRVLEVVAALRSGDDPRAIGPTLTESHISLRDDYEVTVPELDVAVDAALESGAHGARMTGGGFGGSVIALTETDRADSVVRAVERAFATKGFAPPASFAARPSAGAGRVC